MVWVVLFASALAVLLVGGVATLVIIGRSGSWPTPPAGFWLRLGAACALTIVSLALRSLRWVFLLRRAETRVPIRDAYIGYFSGFSLVFVPLLIGEIAVRAGVLRARGRVPVAITAVVNVWERLLDLMALGIIAAALSWVSREEHWWNLALLGVAAVSLIPACRRLALRLTVAMVSPIAALIEPDRPRCLDRLAQSRTWWPALAAGIAAWLLPGAGLWLLVESWGAPVPLTSAVQTYASSSALSGVSLVPAGVLIAGTQMLSALEAHGVAPVMAVITVFAARLATVGVSIALGLVFVLVHVRGARADSAVHFDEIADAYDVQIPESRRHALLDRKTQLMREVIETRGGGRKGLDVGCGQGAYVARMRQMGFDVAGIDASAGQVLLAGRNVGAANLVSVGSVLSIPAEEHSFDFLYIINVLHHLGSIEEQQRAFVELFRVLRPGGLLFVHEINTRNILFRFYMGYVFPSLNCIDEGIERWLLPHRLSQYTNARVAEVRYFTFLPDFIPQAIVRVLRPIERMLEISSLAPYSAHYMAVLVKPPDDPA